MRLFKVPHINVVGGLKLFWDRVTFSRLTKIYFLFSVLHCVVQVVFQVQAFVANADAATFLYGLIVEGNATDPGFAVYDHGNLRMCETVPSTIDSSSCTAVWLGGSTAVVSSQQDNASNTTASSSSVISISASSSAPLSVVVSSTTLSSSTALSTLSVLSSTATSSSSASSASSTSSSKSTATSSSSTASVSAHSSSTHSASTATVTVTAPAATVTSKVDIVSSNTSDSEDSDDESSGSDSDSDDESDDEDGIVAFHHRRHSKRDIVVLPEVEMRLALSGNATVNLQGLDGHNEYELSRKCLYALNWPVDLVENTKREDVAFIAFQIWLLGMSLVALLNESIPHIVASLLTHILATAWGGFQISNTAVFHHRFTTLTTTGACGINLLPDYWSRRSNAEIPSLALNCFALLVSAFLSWRLMKTFGWQTFKRVGASRTINRVYNLVLILSITIQLSLFFVGASAALWLDQVYNGNIGRLTQDPTFFKAMMISVLVLLMPWLATGWISVRHEYRKRMMVFLGVAIFVLVGWATMFIAATFRWTYVTWLFFSLMTTAALLLTITTLVIGIVCRVNFGKGLPRYLNAQEELPDFSYVYPPEKSSDSEKFAFPEEDGRVPTFSVTFGSGPEVPPPAQMRFAPRNMGPRFNSGTTFSDASSNPFASPTESLASGSPRQTMSVRTPSPILSYQTMSSQAPLRRQLSNSSQMSRSSANSASSASSKGSSTRRWVIE